MFVYIFEDCFVYFSQTKPTAIDLECIANGSLSVLHSTSTIRDVTSDGTFANLIECKEHISEGQVYHSPA